MQHLVSAPWRWWSMSAPRRVDRELRHLRCRAEQLARSPHSRYRHERRLVGPERMNTEEVATGFCDWRDSLPGGSIPDRELGVIGWGTWSEWLAVTRRVKVFANMADEQRFRLLAGCPKMGLEGHFRGQTLWWWNVPHGLWDSLLGEFCSCAAMSARERWGHLVTASGAPDTPTVGHQVPGLRDFLYGRRYRRLRAATRRCSYRDLAPAAPSSERVPSHG